MWSTTLGDAHRAARVLMQAIDRDPTQRVASDRLAQLYREKADYKALVALLERRTKALGSIAPQTPGDPRRARARCTKSSVASGTTSCSSRRRRRRTCDGPSSSATRCARSASCATRSQAHRRSRRSRRPRRSRWRGLASSSPTTWRSSRSTGRSSSSGSPPARTVSAEERTLGAELLAGLAEMYDGEHGLAYSAGALDIEPGHDRAVQLYAFYAHALRARTTSASGTSRTSRRTRAARWPARHAGCSRRATRPRARRTTRSRSSSRCAQSATPRRRRSSPISTPRSGDACRAVRAAPRLTGAAPGRRGPASVEKVESALDEAQTLARRASAPRRTRSTARCSRPIRCTPRRSRGSRTTCARSATTRRSATCSWPRPARRARSVEARQDRLREVAGLCESNLRDIDGAIAAWKQLLAHRPVRRDGAPVADAPPREYAALGRPREPLRAGGERRDRSREEARAREEARDAPRGQAQGPRRPRPRPGSASRTRRPRTTQAIATASKMFEKAGALDRAAQVIAANAPQRHRSGGARRAPRSGSASSTRSSTIRRAPATPTPTRRRRRRTRAKLWEAAERCFVAAERWDRAAQAAVQRAELESDAKSQARHFARSADYLARGGDDAGALVNLEQATELDPTNEEYAQQLADRYTASLRWDDLVELLLRRAENAGDAAKRVALRRQAADLYADQLGDRDAARETWRKILEDGDDEETRRAPRRRRGRARRPHRGGRASAAPREGGETPGREGAHRAARGRAPRRRASATSTPPSRATSASSGARPDVPPRAAGDRRSAGGARQRAPRRPTRSSASSRS